MGDFIHLLSAVKNICKKENAKANIYLTDNIVICGGDAWRYGVKQAYMDLYSLVRNQHFVNSFNILGDNWSGEFINLNNFRNGLIPPFNTWTKLLSSTFNYGIPKDYKWLNVDAEKQNKVVIHSSTRRQNPNFSWHSLYQIDSKTDIVFVTFSEEEYRYFCAPGFPGTKVKFVKSFLEMAQEIASAKYFIGNQSAPFALASALDVPRLVILDQEPAPFYMGEQEFSSNISWYLNDSVKYKAENCILSAL